MKDKPRIRIKAWREPMMWFCSRYFTRNKEVLIPKSQLAAWEYRDFVEAAKYKETEIKSIL